MKVRGAPAIAIVACLSLAVELESLTFGTAEQALEFIKTRLDLMKKSRPTAVNLSLEADRLSDLLQSTANNSTCSSSKLVQRYLVEAEQLLVKDLSDNHAIGRNGARLLSKLVQKPKLSVLTHCNTGSLATSGWGTALGIIRELHSTDRLAHVYCTETRPFNQGSRLTSYELVHDRMPATLICDSMAAALVASNKVDAIIVGADRIARNGDTANKIGTLQLAIVAKHYNIPFIVAAPTSSIDSSIENGSEIEIEARAPVEMTQIRGSTVQDEASVKEPFEHFTTTRIKIAADGISVWNPAFDVTPTSLITAIVTEQQVYSTGARSLPSCAQY